LVLLLRVMDIWDGSTSNQQNPSHTYASVAAPTTYTVRLIVSTNFGSGTSSQIVSVTEPAPSAGFLGTPLGGYGPLTVNFTDSSAFTPTLGLGFWGYRE